MKTTKEQEEIAKLQARIKELEVKLPTQNTKFTSYDSIKSYEDACVYLKQVPEDFSGKDKGIVAVTKLCTIYKAINQMIGFKANWQDKNQEKWYPYFNLSGVSVGVVSSYCYCTHWNSSVGSRLCTKNENVAKYIGKQFADLYADWMLEA